MRPWEIAALALSLTGALNAQKAPGNSTPSPNGPTTPRPTQPTTPFPDGAGPNSRPIYISGTVMLSDGAVLTDRAKIERVCNGVANVEAETDKKGRFSFEVGHSLEMPDASVGSDMSGRGNSPFGTSTTNGGAGARTGSTDKRLFGCELRAALIGFRSDVIQLDTIHYMDNPNIGTIILHRMAKVDGLTISVVSALAPKDARKAYEKGRDDEAKNKLDDAQKNFEKAVSVQVRSAPPLGSNWAGLTSGERSYRWRRPRKAYQQAIAAEPKVHSCRTSSSPGSRCARPSGRSWLT